MNQRNTRSVPAEHRTPEHHATPHHTTTHTPAGLAHTPSAAPFSPSAHARYGHSLSQMGASRAESRDEAGNADGQIQLKSEGRSVKAAASPGIPVTMGGGSALPAPVRGKMERSFGYNFADVRVHSGGEAEQVGALAYTRGSDVHFQPGLYAPDSLGGQELLGHELTHVVQQRAGHVSSPQNKAACGASINADAGLEAEADALGARAARGEDAAVSGGGSGVQLKADPDAPIQCKGPAVFSRLKRLFGREGTPEEVTATEGAMDANPLWGGGDPALTPNPLWQATQPAHTTGQSGDTSSNAVPAWTVAQNTVRTPRMDALGARAGSVFLAPAPPSSPAPLLPGISPGAEYKDEDKKYGWRAGMDPALMAVINGPDPAAAAEALARKQRAEARTDLRVTKYLTPEQRAKHAVSVDDSGLLTRASGKLLNTEKGIGGGLNPTGGTEIFAMGTDGGLHTADMERHSSAKRRDFLDKQARKGVSKPEAFAQARERGKIDRLFHHTSFFAGGEVAGAGEIRADKGRVTEISDQSGHYKPKAETTFNAVSHMAKSKDEGGLGVSLMDEEAREAQVRLGGKPGLGGASVSLPVSSFLQTGGNEKQIRAKKGLLPELEHFSRKQAVVPPPGTKVDSTKADTSPLVSPSRLSAEVKGVRNASAPDWMRQLPARPRSQVGADAYGWLRDAGVPDVELKSNYTDTMDLRTPYSVSYVGAEGAMEDAGLTASEAGGAASPPTSYTGAAMEEEVTNYTGAAMEDDTSPAESLLEDGALLGSTEGGEEAEGETLSEAAPVSYGDNPLDLGDTDAEELPSFMQD